MHFFAYVLLPKAEATTSLEARLQVYKQLSEDRSFIGGSGRFSAPLCDWFDIGGEWTGWLYPASLREEFFLQADKLYGEDESPWYSYDFINHHREELDAIWHKLGGAKANPMTRYSSDQKGGEEDDARLMDKPLAELLNTMLNATQQYRHEQYVINQSESGLTPIIISLDDKENLLLLKDFKTLIGQYWVVVIDYQQ